MRPVVIWTWSTGGAVARIVERLALQIRARWPERALTLALHEDAPTVPALRAGGFAVETIAGAGSVRSPLVAAREAVARWRAFSALFAGRTPSIVIVPMNFGLAWPFAERLAAMGHALVYVCHDADPHPGDHAAALQRLTQSRLMTTAARVVFMSHHVREIVVGRGQVPAAMADVLPLLDLGWRRAITPRPIDDGPRRFLFAGRLMAYKGLDLLRDAVSTLAARDDWRLTIAGDGPLADTVRRDFGALSQVDLACVRHVSEAEFDRLIDTHDVLVAPYTEASQSGVIAEAAYAGMPSIVTPVGALAEQIGHGRAGWVTAGIDAPSLAACLDMVAKDREAVVTRASHAAAMGACEPGHAPLDFIDRLDAPA